MTKFYCEDFDNGERVVCDNETEALEIALSWIEDYRKEARFDGEWSMSVETVSVGRVSPSGDPDDDVATHKVRYIALPRDEGVDAFDVQLVAVEGAASVAAP